jgi:mRNA interferase MazF
VGTFAIGDVVLVPFPHADFSRFKKRPALVAGLAEFDNLILCQITSKTYTSKRAIRLDNSDFTIGGLDLSSYIRPDKIFTAEQPIIEKKVGSLENNKLETVRAAIRNIFS